jgi:hypothetical protein
MRRPPPPREILKKPLVSQDTKSPDTKYYQNWLDIEGVMKSPDFKKFSIIKNLLQKRENPRKVPSFVELIYKLRVNAIIMALFPDGKPFDDVLKIDLTDHPGWFDETTGEKELEILKRFGQAFHLFQQRQYGLGLKDFIEADKLFGKLRYDLWVVQVKK